MPLNRAELVAAGEQRPFEDVPTPAGPVRIGVMSGIERAQWDDACAQYSRKTGEGDAPSADTLSMQALLICLTVIDPETGGRMFQDGDVPSICRWQSPIIWPLYTAAYRVNLLGSAAVEEAEKN